MTLIVLVLSFISLALMMYYATVDGRNPAGVSSTVYDPRYQNMWSDQWTYHLKGIGLCCFGGHFRPAKVGVGCLVGRLAIVPWVELIVSWPLWFGGWNCVIESSSFQEVILLLLHWPWWSISGWTDFRTISIWLVSLCVVSRDLFFFMFTTFIPCVIILRIAFIIYSDKSPTGRTDRTPKPEYEQPLRSPLVRFRSHFSFDGFTHYHYL